MKMMYNGTPIKSLNIKHYEMDTNSATMVPSDLQAGVTAFAKGKKVTGTGKSFEFAQYGALITNTDRFVPSDINIIEVACLLLIMRGKYYNRNNGLWYWDAEFTQLWEEAPQW